MAGTDAGLKNGEQIKDFSVAQDFLLIVRS